MFGGLFSSFANIARHATISAGFIGENALAGGFGSLMPVRHKVRCHFPRPSEYKRIKKHGWVQRLSTAGGRRVLMRRILKGKHALSH